MLRRRRQEFHGEPLPDNYDDMLVTAVMPAYNEDGTIEAAIQRVRTVPLRIEIIAVNDCSKDRTGEILDRLHEEGLIDRVIHQQRRGT
jgi:biofilm PGA synthesis N-glycosyltransferase PgaC